MSESRFVTSFPLTSHRSPLAPRARVLRLSGRQAPGRRRALLLGGLALAALAAFGLAAALPGVHGGLQLGLALSGYLSFVLLFRSAMRRWRTDWDVLWDDSRYRRRRSRMFAAVIAFGLGAVSMGEESSPTPTPSPSPTPSASASLHGWIDAGFTTNFDAPRDRINFGTNFNWRSNDILLDQVYLVYEKALEHDNKPNLGYRIDFYAGHQAPFLVSNGLFSNFTGFDPTSGYGLEGQASFRELNRIGIDAPQFYLNAHIPSFLTARGIDVLVGKFWTLMGHEVYPAPQTEFYSHSYEIIYGTPFAHTGLLSTLHATENWDVSVGIVRGSDVFKDNNGRPSFTGGFVWNSSDKRVNWTTAWITGPEQFRNNNDYRTIVTSYLSVKFGSRSQWQLVSGGIVAREANAATDFVSGTLKTAEWYGQSDYLFYTVDPRVAIGMRAEWFRDDDGARTAVTKRPGFAGNFYELTLGVTYKPFEHLRVRPEIRVDRFDGRAIDGSGARPYNDLRAKSQTTAAIDAIWEW